MKLRRANVERRVGAFLRFGWVLDGPGSARYGWASMHPCKDRWEGRTLREISDRLDAAQAAQSKLHRVSKK